MSQMNPIDRLSEAFERFPGIGPRQAGRFVQYLLRQNQSYRSTLADSIKKLSAETAQCNKCFRWFVKSDAKRDFCDICGDARRDASLLFVVEKDADIENVEKSGYRGLYFVLSGTIPLASEEPQKFIRLEKLLVRANHRNHRGDASMKLQEIILGLSATAEGDHTRLILQEKLKNAGPKISSLGRGLSTGSELEYADPDTIASAFDSRN